MRILFVAIASSIHTARWISQITDQGWDIHLLDSWGGNEVHPDLKNITMHSTNDCLGEKYKFLQKYYNSSKRGWLQWGVAVFMRGLVKRPLPSKLAVQLLNMHDDGLIHICNLPEKVCFLRSSLLRACTIQQMLEAASLNIRTDDTAVDEYNVAQLHQLVSGIDIYYLIKELNPDIVHTLETQAAGYQMMKVKKIIKDQSPLWIHTIWGSDIYLFGRLKEHKEKVREVISSCDYFKCECQRDVELAREFGLKGEILPVSTATGGFDLEECLKLRQPGEVSERRIIMLKGYQGWAGRSFVALRALERCADLLDGYEIVIHSALPEPDVPIAVELFTDSTGVPTTIIPHGTPHKEILAYYGKARISIGLSISDGLPNSFLEALVMGAFPIQSWTSCADEWIDDGKTGILVPPEDPETVEQAIRLALTDSELVNEAAKHNHLLVKERLDKSLLKSKAIEIYNVVAKKKGVINEN